MYKVIGADGKEYGPIPVEGLRQWIAEGRANAQTLTLSEGATQWRPLGEFSEFAAALGLAAASPTTPPPFYVAPPRRTNALATVSMVLAVLSFFTCCCCGGLPFNVAALVCSIIALVQIQRDPQQDGRGLAIAALVLSLLQMICGALFFALSSSQPGVWSWKYAL